VPGEHDVDVGSPVAFGKRLDRFPEIKALDLRLRLILRLFYNSFF